MKFSGAIVFLAGSVAAWSPSSFTGSSLKATPSSDATMTMATGMGVNGFGRIGRLVTRIMMEDEDCKLTAINAGSATPDYMAYQYKYDTIHVLLPELLRQMETSLFLTAKKSKLHDAVTLKKSAGVHLELTMSVNLLVSSSPRKRLKPFLTEEQRR